MVFNFNLGRLYGSYVIQQWMHMLSHHCVELGGRFGFREIVEEVKMVVGASAVSCGMDTFAR